MYIYNDTYIFKLNFGPKFISIHLICNPFTGASGKNGSAINSGYNNVNFHNGYNNNDRGNLNNRGNMSYN